MAKQEHERQLALPHLEKSVILRMPLLNAYSEIKAYQYGGKIARSARLYCLIFYEPEEPRV
jgi:hypothetical protein